MIPEHVYLGARIPNGVWFKYRTWQANEDWTDITLKTDPHPFRPCVTEVITDKDYYPLPEAE